MVFTVIVAGIAMFLLLLGTVIPQLRGKVLKTRDLERPDGLTIRYTSYYGRNTVLIIMHTVL